MKVSTPSGEYDIWFKYDPYRIATKAYIQSVSNGEMYQGIAIKSPKDKYSKVLGRKVALAEALRDMFPSYTNKEKRRDIYTALKNRGMKFC